MAWRGPHRIRLEATIIALAALVMMTSTLTPAAAQNLDPQNLCLGEEPRTDAERCPLGPGEQEGQLSPGVNEVDRYQLDPPEDAVLRIHVDASSTVTVRLTDSNATLRSTGDTRFGPAKLSAVSLPQGPWTLSVESSSDTVLTSYNLTLTYEAHDQTARVSFPVSDVPGIAADFQEGQFGRIDFVAVTQGSRVGSQSWADGYQLFFANATDSWEAKGLTVVSSSKGFPGVWSAGTPLSVFSTTHLPRPAETGGTLVVPFEHSKEGGFIDRGFHDVRFAYSNSRGIEEIGAFMAWDDDVPEVEPLSGGSANYARTVDFGGGTGVQVGPVGVAEDLTTSFVTEGNHPSLVWADARSPTASIQGTELTVRDPVGETSNLSGEAKIWFEPRAGSWEVKLQHTDGTEGDQFRFIGIDFPIDVSGLPE